MPHRPSRQDWLASRTTLDRRIAFEEEVCSTPLGRKSWELRQKALMCIWHYPSMAGIASSPTFPSIQ